MEEQTGAGSWTKIDTAPKLLELPVIGRLRHAATYELRNRGISHLLVSDLEPSAVDFDEDSDSWGLTVVAKVGPIYKIRR